MTLKIVNAPVAPDIGEFVIGNLYLDNEGDVLMCTSAGWVDLRTGKVWDRNEVSVVSAISGALTFE